MPAKFKESERVYPRGPRGQRMNTHTPVKKWNHFYLHKTPVEELLKCINGEYTKPKQRQKCLNELARRKVKVVYQMEDGTQIPREALMKYAKESNKEWYNGR